METSAECFEASGLGAMTEQQSAEFLEGVFAADLDGHRLITNHSLWRSFPMIRNARSVMGNLVLLGDAKATAHFSIGSGTKLAMEDAIALFESFRANPGLTNPGAANPGAANRCGERGGGQVRRGRGARPFRARAPRRGGAHPARGRRVAGVVRASAPLLADGPDAVRVRADHALEVDHLRQPQASRPGIRRGHRPHVRARRGAARLRRRRRAAGAADVPTVRAARHGAGEPRRGVADVHVLGPRRPARTTGTSCITAPARSAARDCCSPK